MDAQPAVLSAVNSGVDSCEPLHKVGRELRAGWSRTHPGEEEHEHFAALWAAMDFRLRDGTWDVVLGPFLKTDDNGGLVPRSVGEMPPAAYEVWAVYAPEATHPLVRARLHHLLWAARHGTRPIEHLRSAVHSYRDAAGALLTKAEEHLEALAPLWSRAGRHPSKSMWPDLLQRTPWCSPTAWRLLRGSRSVPESSAR